MERPRRVYLNSAAALTVVIGIASASACFAQSLDSFGTTPQRCTNINCESVQQNGQLNGYEGTTNPWIAIFTKSPSGKDCLRLEVTQQSTDLAIAAVAPDGTVYTDDDSSNQCTNCPRVVIPKTAIGGAY